MRWNILQAIIILHTSSATYVGQQLWDAITGTLTQLPFDTGKFINAHNFLKFKTELIINLPTPLLQKSTSGNGSETTQIRGNRFDVTVEFCGTTDTLI